MSTIVVERSDLEKIFDALKAGLEFHRSRDQMNAQLHMAENVRYSPLTSVLEAERDRVSRILQA